MQVKKEKTIKILLVDDRPDNLMSMEVVLEKDGYSFSKATSGKEALKILLKEDDFSLILLDVKMPIMDGYETAELIYQREKLKQIPIIFITGQDYEEAAIPAAVAGRGDGQLRRFADAALPGAGGSVGLRPVGARCG